MLLFLDDNGTIRWLANDTVRNYVDTHDLCEIIRLLHVLGYNKNSEVYRKLYRDMGYSIWILGDILLGSQ